MLMLHAWQMSALHMWKESPPKNNTNWMALVDVLLRVYGETYHWCPLDRLPQADEERLLAEAVAQHSICEWRQYVENYCHTDEDLPRCDVVLINLVGEETNQHIVGCKDLLC